MAITISQNEFNKEFEDMDRTENFSSEGLIALYNYIHEGGYDIGDPADVDVIDICCTYSEDTTAEIVRNYSIGVDYEQDETLTKEENEANRNEAMEDAVSAYLQYNTVLVAKTNNNDGETCFLYCSSF